MIDSNTESHGTDLGSSWEEYLTSHLAEATAWGRSNTGEYPNQRKQVNVVGQTV